MTTAFSRTGSIRFAAAGSTGIGIERSTTYQKRVRSRVQFPTCEERIVVLAKRTAASAYAEAMKIGAKSQTTYLNDGGTPSSLSLWAYWT